jgi:hypothetical protein
MRNDPLVGRPFPRRNLGRELKPRDQQIQVFGPWGASYLVDAAADSLKNRAPRRQPVEGGLGDARLLGLPARDQAPLLFCNGRESAQSLVVGNGYIIPRKQGLKGGPAPRLIRIGIDLFSRTN